MRSIESEGDTIDQAIENALRALNITRDQVEIEILTGATRGLLGFGGKKARVRATVRAPLLSRLHGLENEVADMDSRETLRSEEHTSELQSRPHLVCRLLLEKKKKTTKISAMKKHVRKKDDL